MDTPGPLTRRGLAETGAALADLTHRYFNAANEARDCIAEAKRARHDGATDEVVLYEAILERAEECYTAALILTRMHADLDYDAVTGTLVRNERHGGAGAEKAAETLNDDHEEAGRSLALSLKLRGRVDPKDRTEPTPVPVPTKPHVWFGKGRTW